MFPDRTRPPRISTWESALRLYGKHESYASQLAEVHDSRLWSNAIKFDLDSIINAVRYKLPERCNEQVDRHKTIKQLDEI